MPILSIYLEEAPVESILDQVLSQTDVSIINAVSCFREKNSKLPTAMELLDELSKSSNLKKTQLYDRLTRLSNRGFISMKMLPRPRRYQVNAETIVEGVEKWVEEQKNSIEGLTNELQSVQNFLTGVDIRKLANAVTNRLSIKTM
jgi:hypothetical protein